MQNNQTDIQQYVFYVIDTNWLLCVKEIEMPNGESARKPFYLWNNRNIKKLYVTDFNLIIYYKPGEKICIIPLHQTYQGH